MSEAVRGGLAENVYDVIVIGAGPIGQNVADRARAAGLTVAVVDGNWSGASALIGPAFPVRLCCGRSSPSRMPAGSRARGKRSPVRWTRRVSLAAATAP
jgi:NADPH-dependent 2,4-dienoyl-CoA reductase/sulfur reductase-like enzyme